jgi:hypothetical protein
VKTYPGDGGGNLGEGGFGGMGHSNQFQILQAVDARSVEDLEKLLVVRDGENAKLTKVNTLVCSLGSLSFGNARILSRRRSDA